MDKFARVLIWSMNLFGDWLLLFLSSSPWIHSFSMPFYLITWPKNPSWIVESNLWCCSIFNSRSIDEFALCELSIVPLKSSSNISQMLQFFFGMLSWESTSLIRTWQLERPESSIDFVCLVVILPYFQKASEGKFSYVYSSPDYILISFVFCSWS